MANLNTTAARELANILSKPSTKFVEYGAMKKEEKIDYYRANYSHEIAVAKAANVEHTFTKVAKFPHVRTITENGAKVAKVNDNYVTDAMAFSAKYNRAMIDEIIGYYTNGGAPEEIAVSYRKPMAFEKFVECDVDFIAWCEYRFGRPENGLIEVSTGYGSEMYELLRELGVTVEDIAAIKELAK